MYAHYPNRGERFIHRQPEPTRSKAFEERAKYHDAMAKWYSSGRSSTNHKREASRLRKLKG
jgi:hypothetical protein